MKKKLLIIIAFILLLGLGAFVFFWPRTEEGPIQPGQVISVKSLIQDGNTGE